MKTSELTHALAVLAANAGHPSPMDLICDRLSSGFTLASVAEEVGCSRGQLYRLAGAIEGGKAAMAEARIEGASALVDMAREVVDHLGASPSREETAAASLRCDMLRWAASRADRASFGGDSSPAVTVNLNAYSGANHLDELKLRATARLAAAPVLAIEPPATDVAEIIDED